MNISDTNLLSLFGKNGSGKTRLLMTMEQSVLSGQVMRMGAETLVDDILACVRNRLATKDLAECYREFETLLIDNLWILASRPRASKIIRELVEARMAVGLLTVLASDMTFTQWSTRQPEMAELIAKGRMAHLS